MWTRCKRCIPPETQVRVTIIPDAEPDLKIIKQGVEALNFYKADQIIALGGGSVIDAAKIMKLQYEFPEADLKELAAPFLDIRKRVVQYPTVKDEPRAADCYLDDQRHGQRSDSVRGDDRQGARLQGHARRLFVDAGRRDRRSAVRDVDAERTDGRYRGSIA